jgi:hypothetical protein
MPALSTFVRRPVVSLPLAVALSIAVLAGLVIAVHGASAQSATGTVTGRVLWGACIRAIPLPMTPDSGQAQPDGQAQQPSIIPQPGQPVRPNPGPITGLPAGAVLVAVQNTGVNTRTDESGKFTLSGVPAGQYLTVGAGPVADAMAATAMRPNVFVNGGESADIGTLALGGSPTINIGCRFPGVATDTAPNAEPAGGAAPAATDTAP